MSQYERIDVQRAGADQLTQETWTFQYLPQSHRFVLDVYLVEQRESVRHRKYHPVRGYARTAYQFQVLRRAPAFRQILLSDVPVPTDVLAEVKTVFTDGLTIDVI